MKLARSLVLSGCLLACLGAFGWVSVASASGLHLESCMEGGECDTATNGSTFKAKGNVTLQNGFLEDTCTSEIKGEIAATLSKSAEEDIKAELTEASYTSCSEGTSLSQGLSWTLTTDFAQFPEALVAGGVKFVLHIGGETGDCTFEEDATHMPNIVWKNGKPTTFKVSGSLKKVVGSTSCGAEVNLSGSYELTSVNDPKLAEAVNLQILEGPTMAEKLEEEELEAEELMEEELSSVRIDTCHELVTECSLASKGTVFQGVGAFVRVQEWGLSGGPPMTTCESELEAEVVSPTTYKGVELDLRIISLDFFNCWPYPVEEEGLPWLMNATSKEFEAELAGALSGVRITETFSGTECSAEGSLFWKFRPYSAEEEEGPFIRLLGTLFAPYKYPCGPMSVFTGGTWGYQITSVEDPELPEAEFLQILG